MSRARALSGAVAGGWLFGLLAAVGTVQLREGELITWLHVEHALVVGDFQLVAIAAGPLASALASWAPRLAARPALRTVPDVLLDGLDAAVAVALLGVGVSFAFFASWFAAGLPVPDVAPHLLQLPDSPLEIARRGPLLHPPGLAVLVPSAGVFGALYAFALFLRGPQRLPRPRLIRAAVLVALPTILGVQAWIGALLAVVRTCSAVGAETVPALLHQGFREALDGLLLGGACSVGVLTLMLPALIISLARVEKAAVGLD